MIFRTNLCRVLLLSAACVAAAPALGQPVAPGQKPPALRPAGSKVNPTLEPVAETRLIMEGVAHANFRGLEQLLREDPADVQKWKFARGQALLIAESANLMMLRPPKGAGQDVWFAHAMKLRETATELSRAAAAQQFLRSRAALVNVANRCNACHTTFRVPVEIEPFAQK